MRFNVVVDVDNDAFGDPGSFTSAFELGRILRSLAGKVEQAAHGDQSHDEADPFVLLDHNGARVGVAYYEEA